VSIKMSLKRVVSLLVIVSVGFSVSLAANANVEIGQALLIKGAVQAKQGEGEARILDRNAPVFESDTITTASKSFAVIKMKDGTRISLRSDTEFSIEEYEYPAAEEKATYNLAKGGLRALTGLIGKQNSSANILKTHVGTMGIRGTEFDARLCSNDCADEESNLKSEKGEQPSTESSVIGRVLLAKGKEITARKTDSDAPRNLTRGSPLYQGDILQTGAKSFLSVAFRDNSRLTVRPKSQVVLAEYKFDSKQASKSKQSTQLVTGGLRMLTGLIGKSNPEAVSIKTTRGTMGIRGTGFDVYHENPVYVYVWQGSVTFCSGAIADCQSNLKIIGEGQVLQASGNGAPVLLGKLPEKINWPEDSRPDKTEVDIQELFGTSKHDYKKPGLLVTVYDGHVVVFPPSALPLGVDLRTFLNSLTGKDLGAGEALFSNGQQIYRLPAVPLIQLFDPIIRPGDASASIIETFGLFPLASSNGGELCVMQ
jgi:hypothetical protein